jgi:predicted transposase/invertase (TIGR01784 family)
MDINKPHDHAFGVIGRDKQNMTDFIRGSFPLEIIEKLALETLHLENDTYLDDKLKDFSSDLVYTCDYNCKKGEPKKIKIVLLFEHKSATAQYIHLQLLRYLLEIWQQQLKQQKADKKKNKETKKLGKLLPVIAVVFYHGAKKWEIRGFYDYFEEMDKQLYRFIPAFDYLPVDLNNYNDEEITELRFRRTLNRLLLFVMKHIHETGYLRKNLEKILKIWHYYNNEQDDENILKTVLMYIYSATDITPAEITKEAERITSKGSKIAMTTAEVLIKQGIERGMERGLEQGIEQKAIEDAHNFLREGVAINVIARCTGLPEEKIRSLR